MRKIPYFERLWDQQSWRAPTGAKNMGIDEFDSTGPVLYQACQQSLTTYQKLADCYISSYLT